MHKVNRLVIVGIVVMLAITGFFFWVQKTSAEIGNIQVYEGNAEIIGDDKTSDAKTGQTVKIKDTIRVSGGSKVAIALKDSSVIRLDENTEVEIGQLSYQGQKIKDATFKLTAGRLWSRVAPLEQNGDFEVETPTVVASVRGTSFNTTSIQKITGVYVYKKKVDVRLKKINETQTVPESLVLRMRNENIGEDFKKGPQIPDPKYFDDWIKFNQEEDNKICRDNPKTPGCENEDLSLSPTPSQTPTPSPTYFPTVKPTLYKSPFPTQKPTSTPTPKPSPTPTPIPKKVVNFQISHDTQNDCYTSCQFSALAYFDNNPNKSVNVTKDTKWSIKSPANGSISAYGYYTQGKTKGDTIIGSYGITSANHSIPSYTTPSIL